MTGRLAMATATRDTRWGPMADPVAEFIMRTNFADAICEAIPDGVTPLSGGLTSVVFAYGDDQVVRVGGAHDRPYIPEMLQATSREVFGGLFMVEILPRVQCDLSAEELEWLVGRLAGRGYAFEDLGTDNAGRLPDGSLVVIDPGAIVWRRDLTREREEPGLEL